MKTNSEIEKKIQKLSPELIKELDHFLDNLLNKDRQNKSKGFKQNWAGDLKDSKFTSIQLQKMALDWRVK